MPNTVTATAITIISIHELFVTTRPTVTARSSSTTCTAHDVAFLHTASTRPPACHSATLAFASGQQSIGRRYGGRKSVLEMPGRE